VDAVNAAFEALFALLIWANVRRLLLDKRVEGVSLWVQGFACVYGFWAVFLYASLGMWLSFACQILMSLGSSVWLVLAFWYRRR
jgi:hypothetical protein